MASGIVIRSFEFRISCIVFRVSIHDTRNTIHETLYKIFTPFLTSLHFELKTTLTFAA